MFRSLKSILGYTLQVTDGRIGAVKDFFLDDQDWKVRYVIADTGEWILGKEVILPMDAFEPPVWDKKTFPVHLTRAQIENSPDADLRSFNRFKENQLSEYYQIPPYWMARNPAVPAYGMGGVHPRPERSGKEMRTPTLERTPPSEQEEMYLTSLLEIKGSPLHAKDGKLGEVEDLIVNDLDWAVHYLVADTGSWLSGRKVLIARQWITELHRKHEDVKVDLTMQQIQRSPEYNPSEPVNEEYAKRLYDYYGRPA